MFRGIDDDDEVSLMRSTSSVSEEPQEQIKNLWMKFVRECEDGAETSAGSLSGFV